VTTPNLPNPSQPLPTLPNLSQPLLALALLLHLILVGSVATQALDPRVPATTRRFLTSRLYFDAEYWPGPGGDFFALYHGGLQVRRGLSPHDLTPGPGDNSYFFRYIYSPDLAQTLGRIVTLLPPRPAYLAWLGTIELTLFSWIALIWRQRIADGVKTFAIALLLISQPYVLELHMGQFTFMATSLALAAAWLTGGQRLRRGAAFAAIFAGTLLKTFPLVTLPAYIRARAGRSWPALAGGCLAAAIVLGPALLNRGNGHVALGMVDSVGVPHPGAESLAQAVFLVVLAGTGEWIPTRFPLVPELLVVLSVGVTAVLVIRRPALGVLRSAAAMVMAFFLGYLHAWEHHYAAVLLAGTLVLLELARNTDHRDARVRALGAALVVLALPSPYVLAGPHMETWTLGTWLALSLSKAVPTAVALFVTLSAEHAAWPAEARLRTPDAAPPSAPASN
jgi:hypothetical protein